MLTAPTKSSEKGLFDALYDYVHKQDDMIGDCFDDHRRSKAKMRIMSLARHNLFTDEELEGFSEDVKETAAPIMQKGTAKNGCRIL